MDATRKTNTRKVKRSLALLTTLMAAVAMLAANAAPAAARTETGPRIEAVPVVGRLLVKVLDQSGRRGIAGAMIVISNEGGAAMAKGESDKAGNYTTSLQEGIYKVAVEANGYAGGGSIIKMAVATDTELTIKLNSLQVPPDADPSATPARIEEGWLKIGVFEQSNPNSASKNPVANASILVVDRNGIATFGNTDKDGLFEAMVPEGRYTVTVQARGFYKYNQLAKVLANRITDMTATLRRDVTLPPGE